MDEFEQEAAYDEFDPDYIINNYLTDPEARETLEIYADPAGYESAALLFQNMGFDFTDNKENPITEYIPNKDNFRNAESDIIKEITNDIDLPADQQNKKWTIKSILLSGMNTNMIPVKTDDPELSKKWQDTINQAHYQDKTDFENEMKNRSVKISDTPRDPDQELETLLNSLQSPADASKTNELESFGFLEEFGF